MNSSHRAEGFPGQRIVVLPRNVLAHMRRNPLVGRLFPTDIGYFPMAKSHLFERPEGVDQVIFIFCSKGQGWCEIGGRRHEVFEGDLLVIPPGEAHSYGADEEKPWTIFWFHATGDDMRLLLPELGVSVEHPVRHLGDDPQLPAIFAGNIGHPRAWLRAVSNASRGSDAWLSHQLNDLARS